MAIQMLLVWLGLLAPVDQSKLPPALPPTAVSRAGWLSGCWGSQAREVAPTQEMWTAASNELVVGRSTSGTPGGVFTEFVFLRIESAGGVLSLVRQAPGERPERLAHDATAPAGELAFVGGTPGAEKRISYRRDAKKKDLIVLRTTIEGSKALEVPMKKHDCR